MLPFSFALTLLVQGAVATSCPSKDTLPNTIYEQYPNAPTGSLNGTVAVLPIPNAMARKIVPSQWPILTRAYEELMPELDEGMYPALLELGFDHDVRAGDIKIPDFQRASISFPFVDRLNDGYTSMDYGYSLLISSDVSPLAIAGIVGYGYTPFLSTFEPCGQAYASEPGSASSTYSNATSIGGVNGSIDSVFTSCESVLWSIDVIKNLTSQPQFSNNALICDNYIRLFNTSLTEPPHAPVPVKGTVRAVAPVFPETMTWSGVYGYNLANAFVEYGDVPCGELKGYRQGDQTGSGEI